MSASLSLSREFRDLADYLLDEHGKSADLALATETLEKEQAGQSSDGLDQATAAAVLGEIRDFPQFVLPSTLLQQLLDQDSREAALQERIVGREQFIQWVIVYKGLYLSLVALIALLIFGSVFHFLLVFYALISAGSTPSGPVEGVSLALGLLVLLLIAGVICLFFAQGQCRRAPRISGVERMAAASWLTFVLSPMIPIFVGIITFQGMELKEHQKNAAFVDLIKLGILIWTGILSIAEVFFLLALSRLARFFGRAKLSRVVACFLLFFVLFAAGTLAYGVFVPPPKPASIPGRWDNAQVTPKNDNAMDLFLAIAYVVIVPIGFVSYIGIIKKSYDSVGRALLNSEYSEDLES